MTEAHTAGRAQGGRHVGFWRLSLSITVLWAMSVLAITIYESAFGWPNGGVAFPAMLIAGGALAVLGLWLSPGRRNGFREGGRACDAADTGVTIGLGALAGLAWSVTPYASLLDLTAQGLGAALGALLAGILFAAPFRASGARDVVELLSERFESSALRLLAVILCVAGLGALTAGALAGAGAMLAAAQPSWTPQIAVGVSAALAAAAVARGGLGSETSVARAAATAVILAFVLSPLILFAAPQAVFHDLFLMAPFTIPILEEAPPEAAWRALCLGASALFGVAAAPHLLARSGAARSLDAARGGAVWAIGFVLLVASMAPFYLIIASARQDLSAPFDLFTLLFNSIPWFPIALGVAAYAALLAIAAGAALAAANILAATINRALSSPYAPAVSSFRLSQAMVITVLTAAALLAPPSAIEGARWITFALSLLAAALFAPLVMAFWSRRATATSMIAASLTGAATTGALLFSMPLAEMAGVDLGQYGARPAMDVTRWAPSLLESAAGALGALAGLIAGLAATPFCAPPSNRQLERFEAISGPIGDPPFGRDGGAV